MFDSGIKLKGQETKVKATQGFIALVSGGREMWEEYKGMRQQLQSQQQNESLNNTVSLSY